MKRGCGRGKGPWYFSWNATQSSDFLIISETLNEIGLHKFLLPILVKTTPKLEGQMSAFKSIYAGLSQTFEVDG